MDHETCSAHLPQLVRGELADADRRALEDHLASCPDCASELVAVQALMSLPDVHMTADERRALHRAVLTPQPRRWARLAPALGAVGLLVVAAVGVTYFIGDGNDPFPAAGQSETDPDADAEQTLEQQAGRAAAPQRMNEGAAAGAMNKTTADAATGPDTEAYAADALGVVTTFSSVDLGPHLLTYEETRSLPTALRALRRNAPNAGRQLTECTGVLQGAYESELVPAFASVYPADQLLVMGFVFRSGTEQRYAFWGWHLGDCARPTPIYVTGALQ